MSGLSLRLPNLHQITASSWSVSHLLLQTKKSQEQDEESKNQENIWASKWSWSIVNNMSWMQIIRDISAILTYFNIFQSKMLLTSENSIFFLSTPWNSGLNPSSFLFLHFACVSSFAFGIFQIPIPLFLWLDLQPNTAQFSPGKTPT